MREYIFWGFILCSIPYILKRPFWGVVLYTVLNIIRPEMLFWGGAQGAKVFIVLISITILATFLKSANPINFPISIFSDVLRHSYLRLILWLYIALVVSIELSSYEIPLAYYYANEILKMLVLCFLIVRNVDDAEKIKKYEKILLVVFVLLGVWGIEQHFRGNVRLEGFALGESNGLAATFVLFLPLAFNQFLYSKDSKGKVIGFFMTLVFTLLIIFTQSRGGFLGASICTAYMILKSKNKLAIIIATLFIFMLIPPFISENYTSRLSTLKNEESLDGSAKSRIVLWQAGLKIFSDHPLFGTGFMSFPYAKYNYKDTFDDLEDDFIEWVFREKSPKVTHNTYIQILADGGLFAFLPFLIFIFSTFTKNRRVRKSHSVTDNNREMFDLLFAIEGGIIGNCVCIMFMDAITAIFLPIQIIMSSIIRDLIIKRRSEAMRTVGLISH